jgi:CPA1 family monovalent cation:H+ antiporter
VGLRHVSRIRPGGDPRPAWPAAAVVSWVGTRGVVPLAAALSIPLTTASGTALPQRDLVLVLAAAAIVVSLILQGFTLEPLARLAGFGRAGPAGPRREETVAGCGWPRPGWPAWRNWPETMPFPTP